MYKYAYNILVNSPASVLNSLMATDGAKATKETVLEDEDGIQWVFDESDKSLDDEEANTKLATAFLGNTYTP